MTGMKSGACDPGYCKGALLSFGSTALRSEEGRRPLYLAFLLPAIGMLEGVGRSRWALGSLRLQPQPQIPLTPSRPHSHRQRSVASHRTWSKTQMLHTARKAHLPGACHLLLRVPSLPGTGLSVPSHTKVISFSGYGPMVFLPCNLFPQIFQGQLLLFIQVSAKPPPPQRGPP